MPLDPPPGPTPDAARHPGPHAEQRAERHAGPGVVRAPFAGVVTLLAREGERVVRGQRIAVLEAVKLEAPLSAPRSGRVRLGPGAPQVAGGDVVLTVE